MGNKVVLFKKLLGVFEICPPNYWDGLTSAQILGSDFWNGQELVLGQNALQLTVCKALQKINSGISRNELDSEEFDGEMEKVRLKVEFELANDRNVQVEYLNASLEVLPVDEQKCKVGFSSVLFDKVNLTNIVGIFGILIYFIFSKNIAWKLEKFLLVGKFATTVATIFF